MLKLAVIVLVLCSFATGCTQKDTAGGDVWPRNVEPRLTSASEWRPCRKSVTPGRVVDDAECGTPPRAITERADRCEGIISTHVEAVRLLAFRPGCTDAAITELERFARVDAGAMSDLAAAYYLRAQREDRPAELLRALDAADHALAAAPRSPTALFNRAVIQEALGLSLEAIGSWNDFLAVDDSEWADEARIRRDRLEREFANGATARWKHARRELSIALAARDAATVARLIAPFPSTAQTYFEDELLTQWAATPTADTLARVKIAGVALSQRSGDRYAIDIVEALERSAGDPERQTALQLGLLAYGKARFAERSFKWADAAAAYQTAIPLLDRGGVPLRLGAQLRHAVCSYVSSGTADAFSIADAVDRIARTKGYRSLVPRIHFVRGYLLALESRHVEALAEYEKALDGFGAIGDLENVANIRTRTCGELRVLGQDELAWREAIQALRHNSRVVEPQARHVLLGEAAAAALALGHPRFALDYQSAAVRLIQDALADTPPEQVDRIRKFQQNLAISLRTRAGIELRLERYDRAKHDLAEAVRLSAGEIAEDAANRRALEARLEEIRGEAAIHTNPDEAVAAFTRGLAAATDERRTFRASLFVKRADAERRSGRKDRAERDLKSALAELHHEETANLARRRRGEREEIWASYFARFDDTYRLLVKNLVENGRAEEAFIYAERARALEPLDLLLKLETVPPDFRRLVRHGRTIAPAVVQRSLPAGTFLIAYSVLQDRTYAWIVSRETFELITLRAAQADVARWTAALQQAARQRNPSAFDAGLYAPYDELIEEPLSVVARALSGRPPSRLVFIPDGAMHGLPIAALRDPVTRRHLIEDAPVSIAGSSALYVFSLMRDRALSPPSASSILLLGDPAFNEELPFARGLARLPRARREVERIRGLYDARGGMYIGGSATVASLVDGAADHHVVHIAAHAIANAQAPWRSLLLLAPDTHHTGAIDAEELLTRLKLDNTSLVVLSACSSAGGVPVGPEGLAPLVRPFIAAGVPGVIGTLWEVDDATAEELMVSFHRHYREGSDAAVAMQRAQLELLRNDNPGLRSVLAWAPFQVIGHTGSSVEVPP